ncbi:MAG: hypothetical protein ACETV0_01650 [Nitrososphaeria archaeon]
MSEPEPLKRKKRKYSRGKKIDQSIVNTRAQAVQRINLRRDLKALLEAIARAKRTIKETA